MARSPLLNLYDPYGIMEMQARAGMLPGQDPFEGGRPLQISDLMSPAEKQSSLRWLAERGTSGLATAADALDTLGSGVRGLLVGKPLSVLGEEATGQRRVTGRDVLREYGLIGDEDNWGNFAGGLAVEVLTDPLTYLNPFAALGRGAATAAGKIGARSGLTRTVRSLADDAGVGVREFARTRKAKDFLAGLPAEEMAAAKKRYVDAYEAAGLAGDALEQPFFADMTFNVPFTGIDQVVLQDSGIGKQLDKLGSLAARNRYTGPALGRLGAMFDSGTQGAFLKDPEANEALQRVARIASEQYVPESERAVKRLNELFAAAETLAPIKVGDAEYSIRSPEIQRVINDLAEGVDVERMADSPFLEAVQGNKALSDIADYVRDISETRQDMLRAAGVKPTVYESTNFPGMRTVPRQRMNFRREMLPKGVSKDSSNRFRRSRRIFGVEGGKARRDYMDLPQWIVRGLTSGEQGGKLAEALRNASDAKAPAIIDDAYRAITGYEGGVFDGVGDAMRSAADYDNASMVARDAVEKKIAERTSGLYTQLADTLRNIDTQFATENRGFYDAPLYDTLSQALRSDAKDIVNSRAVTNFLQDLDSRGLLKTASPEEVLGGSHVSLKEVADKFRLDTKAPEFVEIFGDKPGQLSIPKAEFEALSKLSPQTFSDEPVSGVAEALKKYMTAWKIGALLSPSYVTRNLISGLYGGAALGAADPLDYLAANSLARGNAKPLIRRLKKNPEFAGLADDEVLRRFTAMSGQTDVFGGLTADELGFGQGRLAPNGRLDKLAEAGRKKKTLYDYTLGPVLAKFQKVNQGVEDTLRGGMFLNQIRRGGDAGAAADLARLAQVDYRPQAFTPFENQYLRGGLVPFYSFQRGILPSVATQLAQKPGGLMGQTMRAINRGGAPNEDSFAPEYIRSQGSIALPSSWSPEGNQLYLTQFGLPFEDAFNTLTPGQGNTLLERAANTLGNTLSSLAGDTHPLAKYLIEQATGKQLYSGRNLSDLYSVLESGYGLGTTGRQIQQAITNLVPFGSRAMSVLQTLSDGRRPLSGRAWKSAANFALPFKVADVDQEQARSRAARTMLEQLLKSTPGVRSYENITVAEKDLMAMTPEQRDLYLLYRVVQADAQKRARLRRSQEAAGLLGGLPLAN